MKAENYYELISKQIKSSRGNIKELANLINEYSRNIWANDAKYHTFKFKRFAYNISILEFEVSRDYTQMVTICKKAIQHFEGLQQSTSKILLSQFYIKILSAYIPLKRFHEGKNAITRLFELTEKGSLNWFIALEHYYLLSLHTDNYQKAHEIYHEAVNHRLFKNLSPQYSEMWYIYEAYLEWLIKVGKLHTNTISQFRLGKFMNQVPQYSKDKKGINISILIIQTLFLIAQGKQDNVIDRLDSLDMYVYNYLRNDDSLRSNCLIKMLLKMVQANFHKAGTIRKTKKLHEKLINTPMATKGHSQYVEIIPYETLWEISLTFLKNRPI